MSPRALPFERTVPLAIGDDDVVRTAAAPIHFEVLPNRLPDPLPVSGVLEALGESFGAAGKAPGGKQDREESGRGRVGILVNRHIHASRHRFVHEREARVALTPHRGADHLVMSDLGGEAPLLPDADRLAHRVEQRQPLLAQVADVHAAVAGGHPGEGDDLLGLGEGAGEELEPGGKTERSLAHRGVHQAAHGVEFGFGRRPVLHSQDFAAHGPVPDEEGHVDRGTLRLEPVQPLANRQGRAAIRAADGGGHALPQVVLGERVTENTEDCVTVDIHQAGDHREAGDVGALSGACGGQVPDRGDAVAADADIRHPRRAPAPVVHIAARQNPVVAVPAPAGGQEESRDGDIRYSKH